MAARHRTAWLVVFLLATTLGATAEPRFEVRYPAALDPGPLDGRILLLFSTRSDEEPRFHVVSRTRPQPFFGIDVEDLQPGDPAVIDAGVLGYPLESLSGIPPGRYWVQAVLNRYTTFRRGDGHVVKLPMDRWEGQQWNRSPGNLYSTATKIDFDPSRARTVEIELTNLIPPIDPPPDTKWVKHVKIRSELASAFWGQDMFVGAVVLQPPGFEEHPEARYPVAYLQGHFSPTLRQFRDVPPDEDATGRRRRSQESAYALYEEWSSGELPKMLVVLLQDPNPYYDDAYAVNSENVGPYGDVLTKELVPHVEQQFRAIGEPWARTLFGGSTGGWRALAAQIFYPDLYNGAWAFCPDPVDFRYFQLVDIYEDDNAYYPEDDWKKNPIRPWMRSVDDQVLMTERDASILELVLGTRGRSGEQMDAFQAVYGPVGEDGYPALLYDKKTGIIDKRVASHWKENYDLRYILERDWEILGPKLEGKIRIYMGDTDTYYLEEATRLMERFLEQTNNPHYRGTVEWGGREPHCWTGAPEGKSFISHYLPEMADHLEKTAPAGADLASWKY